MLAAGYAPAIGFLHSGKPQSFVYDIADILKFETVVPEAFRVAARSSKSQPAGRHAVSIRSARYAAVAAMRSGAPTCLDG